MFGTSVHRPGWSRDRRTGHRGVDGPHRHASVAPERL